MKTLRCMAYEQNGVFVAACLDLSLAAQADTMQEALAKLELQLKDYLAEAYSDKKYTDQLLNRKAPISMWFKYWGLVFKIFFGRKQSPLSVFRKPCHGMA